MSAAKTSPDPEVLLLSQLPKELLRHVVSFMDVPMLGRTAQVHSGVLRELANAELVWTQLVQQRFQIVGTRPKTFGGRDWKESYCSMHLCNRMPKCRWTNRKPIFAKSEGRNSLSVWVTLNHTENCRTRALRTSQTPHRRYVEFWVCLQNVKSNGTSIRIDSTNTQLQFMGGMGTLYSESPVQEELSCGYRWVLPRLLHKHSKKASTGGTHTTTNIKDDIHRGIWLKPLEFCIVSIPFACAQDSFETDFLARSVSLTVPYVVATNSPKQATAAAATTMASTCTDSFEAQAWFVSESIVWDHYCELPGGCMTLSDRERRLHL